MENKTVTEMTFEHVIPQCLGGAFVPNQFKTDRVCSRCNSNLGLFVDASFEKSWLVSNWLRTLDIGLHSPTTLSDIPLICMGLLKSAPPGIKDDEVCEVYLGPNGETVYWIRPIDEKFYWYVGGNPRTSKQHPTQAYFFFVENSGCNPDAAWVCFKNAFKGRKVRKVLGTRVEGADPSTIGFSIPDQLDERRLEYFRKIQEDGSELLIKTAFNLNFDHRFLAKLARGIGFCLFGDKVLADEYGKELTKGIWHQPNAPPPNIRGSSTFSNPERDIDRLLGHPQSVTLTITNLGSGVCLTLNIGGQMTATVLCAEDSSLDEKDRSRVGDGLVLVIFRFYQRSCLLSLPDFLAHKSGSCVHPDLAKIESAIGNSS